MDETESTVHLLPCTIDFNGPAPISNFFITKPQKIRGENKLISHFRGRQLIGETVALPEGSKGLCVHSTPTSNSVPRWTIDGTFSSLTVWDHDRVPDASIAKDVQEWFELSDAIHN